MLAEKSSKNYGNKYFGIQPERIYTNTFTTQREIPYLQTCTPASLFWRCLTFNKLQNILEKGVFPLFLTNQMITEKFSHL